MARPPSNQPTDAELEILKVLWEQGPAGLGPIHAAIQENRPVALTTIATTLKTMLAKGLVRATTAARLRLVGRGQPRVHRHRPARQARPARLRRLGAGSSPT